MKRRFVVLLPFLLLLTATPAGATTGDTGYDVGWPQCTGSAFTSVPPGTPQLGVVGVNHGVGRSTNPCLGEQAAWAKTLPGGPTLYANGADPGPTSGNWPASGQTSPARCLSGSSTSDTGCAYDYGWGLGSDALTRAAGQTAFTATSVPWWIDVEVANSWALDGLMNTASIQGMVDRLRSAGVPDVGVYALTTDWATITGSSVGPASYTRATSSTYRAHWAFTPAYPIEDGPVWFAGAGTQSAAQTRCGTTSFTGGERLLSQYTVTVSTTDWDGDYRCADRDLTAPSVTLTAPTTLIVTAGTTRLAWSAADNAGGSGLASYDLQRATAPYNGPLVGWAYYRRLLVTSVTTSSPARGSTDCWYARSRDAAGNLSALSNRRCVLTPLDDRDLAAGSGWTRTTGATNWFNGSFSSATKLGATLSRASVRTTHLELLAYRCPTCGSVTVLLNGSPLRTVSLASSTSGRAWFALPRFSLRTVTVSLRVATSGKLVRVDGLATSGVV